MEIKTLLIVFLVLVLIDKGLTIANILLVNKNFPLATKNDYYVIERNPLAKWFFNKFGLISGTLLYGVISIFTLFIAYYLLTLFLSDRVALYIIVMLYALVIANNTYFMLKYGRIIS